VISDKPNKAKCYRKKQIIITKLLVSKYSVKLVLVIKFKI